MSAYLGIPLPVELDDIASGDFFIIDANGKDVGMVFADAGSDPKKLAEDFRTFLNSKAEPAPPPATVTTPTV